MKLTDRFPKAVPILIALLAGGVLVVWLAGCAGVPVMRPTVMQDGTVTFDVATPHDIPGTGITLWTDVEHADGTMTQEVPDGPLPIPGLPWYVQIGAALAIRALATKSGRANLSTVAAGGTGLVTRVAALVASTGVTSSPPAAVARRSDSVAVSDALP